MNTMKLLALISLVSSVYGFVPSAQEAKVSGLSAVAPEKEVGVLPPVGFFECVTSILNFNDGIML